MPFAVSKWIAALPLAGLLAACAGAPPPLPPLTTSLDQKAVVDFNTCSKPDYPWTFLKAKPSGLVVTRFLVGIDGVVRDARIVHSTGFDRMGQISLSALGKCRFKPAQKDGQQVEAWTDVQYYWTSDYGTSGSR